MKQKRPEWYKSFCYPYGWYITNGEEKLEPFFYWNRILPTFTFDLDNAGFYQDNNKEITFVLRYLNLYWR